MARSDYMPDKEGEFNLWQINFMTYLVANATAWGVPADVVTEAQGLQTKWTTAYAKSSNAQNRTRADTGIKNGAHKVYKKRLRSIVSEYVVNSSKVSNDDREHMGITIKSDQRTPAPVPTSSPIGRIDYSRRMLHLIYFSDSESSSRGKPEGVYGCEIWIKRGGEEPKSNTEFTYLAIDTKSPYQMSFTLEDIGKRMYYLSRWINTRGETGPWSIIISAVVAG